MILRPLFLLALLGAPSLSSAQGTGRPGWVTVLPRQEGRVYAMGLATYAPSEAQALAQAASNARAEVLTRLRAEVKSDTTIQSQATLSRELGGQATGSSQQRVGQSTRIQTQATALPGLVVEETWADPVERAAYALAYLDIPVAERELRSRFTALDQDLAREAAVPAPPKERLRLLGRRKGAQVELAKLDDMAALLSAGGGDEQLRNRVRAARLDLERRQESLRASLTFSLEPGASQATRIGAILRNAALKAGLGWTEGGGEFLLALDYRTENPGGAQDWNGWWKSGWVKHTANRDMGIVVARGLLEVTLKDRDGNQYQSVEIEAKGVGVSDFQAEQRLKEDFQGKLEKQFGKWLEKL